MSDEETAEGVPVGSAAREGTASPDGADGKTSAGPEARLDELGEEADGPVSESTALQTLVAGGGPDEAERSEAARASAIADMIAERLNSDAAGTRIGTLALFNDTVSFGGGFHTGARDKTDRRQDSDAAIVPLDEGELAEHTELYIHPSGYDEALDSLSERHLLMLTAPPGSGREAAAVNLLAEMLAVSGTARGTCHRVLDPAQLTSPGWEPPVEEGAYLAVLEDGPDAVAASSSAGLRALAGVAAALRATRSYLVLVGGHDLAIAAPAVATAAWHELAPVDPVTIVERRVLGSDPDDDYAVELRTLLEKSGAEPALHERPSAQHAVRLASVIRAGGDLAAAVATLRDPSDQVSAWFNRHRGPEAVAFALAAAVLEESSYLTVADAAVALRIALSPVDDGPPDIRFRDRLSHEQPWIEVVFEEHSGIPGPPRVRFRSPLLRQVVLAYAWTRLDGRRGAVLQWLRGLLTHPDLEVRARVAVAAGLLTWADHHYAVHRFLKSWAASKSWPVRQGAATALGVAGGRPEASEPIWRLLDTWAREGSSAYDRRLAGTAANALGGLLGRNHPTRALRVLHDALDRGDDWGTLTPVAWAGVHLINQGRVAHVLDAYLDWSQPQDLSPMVVRTLSAFVFAASTPYDEHGGTGSLEGAVPGMPHLLSTLADHLPPMQELWARALARKPVQNSALVALRTWIDDYAALHPAALGGIEALLVGIATRPGKYQQRLLYWLEAWARDRDQPSRNAARLREAVRRAP